MVRAAPTFEELASKVAAELEDMVIVAHQARFDLPVSGIACQWREEAGRGGKWREVLLLRRFSWRGRCWRFISVNQSSGGD
jgi:hypothetical protein